MNNKAIKYCLEKIMKRNSSKKFLREFFGNQLERDKDPVAVFEHKIEDSIVKKSTVQMKSEIDNFIERYVEKHGMTDDGWMLFEADLKQLKNLLDI